MHQECTYNTRQFMLTLLSAIVFFQNVIIRYQVLLLCDCSYSLFFAALCVRVSWSRPYWTCCHCVWDYLLSFKVSYGPDFRLHISHSHWSIFRILSVRAHCISTGLGTKAQLLYGVCQCSNTRINQWNVLSTSYKFVYIRKCIHYFPFACTVPLTSAYYVQMLPPPVPVPV